MHLNKAFLYNMRIEDEKCFNILKKDKLRKNGEKRISEFSDEKKTLFTIAKWKIGCLK